MSIKLTPAIKGLITALVMLITNLVFYYTKSDQQGLQYISILLFIAGIVWTLLDYKKSPAFTGKFGDIFGQGFRFFIVVALVSVVFTAIFIKLHPELAELQGEAYREYLVKEQKSMPAEIDKKVADAKSNYLISQLSVGIFGYLIFGALITAGISAFLTRRTQ